MRSLRTCVLHHSKFRRPTYPWKMWKFAPCENFPLFSTSALTTQSSLFQSNKSRHPYQKLIIIISLCRTCYCNQWVFIAKTVLNWLQITTSMSSNWLLQSRNNNYCLAYTGSCTTPACTPPVSLCIIKGLLYISPSLVLYNKRSWSDHNIDTTAKTPRWNKKTLATTPLQSIITCSQWKHVFSKTHIYFESGALMTVYIIIIVFVPSRNGITYILQYIIL